MEERKGGRKLVNSLIASERGDVRKLKSDISHLSNLYLYSSLL